MKFYAIKPKDMNVDIDNLRSCDKKIHFTTDLEFLVEVIQTHLSYAEYEIISIEIETLPTSDKSPRKGSYSDNLRQDLVNLRKIMPYTGGCGYERHIWTLLNVIGRFDIITYEDFVNFGVEKFAQSSSVNKPEMRVLRRQFSLKGLNINGEEK